ncbi:MAG: hypothetical protein CR981_00350 [Proteobacteria bacterium]|nr:MAG: hypothetical protein CR981_00350 [Pseudomonadota bacterium]
MSIKIFDRDTIRNIILLSRCLIIKHFVVACNEGKRISINALGTISALDAIGNREEIGRIAIVDIDDRSRLKRTANTMFQLDEEGQERPVQEPQIISGSLELANVNMVEEMARMINNNKLYQIYHKVIKGYATISEKQDELGTVS